MHRWHDNTFPLQPLKALCCVASAEEPVCLQAKLKKVQEAAGFVRVFERLRESGKPAVGHNCLFDLAFTLEHLAEPLPEDWPSFKQLVKKWFPGVSRCRAGPLCLAQKN